MAKVYVSSTFVDLEDCRRQVSILLRRMGHEDVAMEYYTAGDQRSVDKCLADVAACDLYVGIFAWRYGWIPTDNNPEQISITEMEYRHAVTNGKECLIFLLHEDVPWPRKFIDRDPFRIEQLRTYLSNKHLRAFFKSAEDIGSVVGPAIYNWAKEHGHISPGAIIPEFDLEAYFIAIKKKYQRLDLAGLTPPQREEYLQLQLRSVFVGQSVRENPPPVELPKETWERLHREKEIYLEDLPEGVTPEDIIRLRESYYEKPVRAVLNVLTETRYQRAIILGDPGSGKSTLARYVLLSLIDPAGDEKLHNAFDGYLPLLIELRSYAGLCADKKCKTFLEFLEYLGETEGWHLTKNALHQHLKDDGRAVVIFDGLDEIFNPEERERITRQIVGFASDYPKVRIIATSRIIGYRRKILTDAEFAHFTLQDLDESQVATFVDRWYGLALSDRPEEAKERRERILRSFKESASIRQLAGNPMLLTIMAIISKHQELPRERWKLYDHAASVLIEHWDVNRHLKDQSVQADFIGQDEKKEMLRRLAFKMQSGTGGLAGNYIHQAELQAEFESYLKERYRQPDDRAVVISRAIIAQFRERNFILSLYGANLYGFVHRAFLEFFCASAFVSRFEKTREMTLEQLKQDVYGLHWNDQSWREVLRLICGMIDEKFAGEIIDGLINVPDQPKPEEYENKRPWHIVLAVQCLGELRNLTSIAEPAGRLLKTLCSLYADHICRQKQDNRPYDIAEFIRSQIASSLDAIGSTWPQRLMIIQWLQDIKSLNIYTYSDDAELFGDLVGFIGSGLEQVHEIILEYAKNDDPELRFLSTYVLPVGWRNEPQTLLLLLDRAVNDSKSFVREAALENIGDYFHEDVRSLSVIQDRAVNDAAENVRVTALDSLATYFHDNTQVLLFLRECAINDASDFARYNALAWLANYFPDDAETLSFLRERAVSDLDEWVRVNAEALVDRLSENILE